MANENAFANLFDADGAGAPLGVAPVEVAEGESTVRLPPWKGNGKDSTTIELWIDQVDRTATQKQWNGARTAAAVCDSLKENAARWMAVQKAHATKRVVLQDWKDLKPALKKRFADALTQVQRQSYAKGLIQASNESAQDFFDRVAFALSMIHENRREALAGAELEGQRKGYDASQDVSLGSIFASGLRADIREYVELQMEGTSTSDELLQLAIKSETSKGLGAKTAALKLAVVNAGDERSEEMKRVTEELAALKSRLNTFSGGAKKNGNGQTDKKKTPLPPWGERRTWFYCYKCKQHGLHVSRECRLTQEQRDSLIPQPRFPIPTTTPHDEQYPNGL